MVYLNGFSIVLNFYGIFIALYDYVIKAIDIHIWAVLNELAKIIIRLHIVCAAKGGTICISEPAMKSSSHQALTAFSWLTA